MPVVERSHEGSCPLTPAELRAVELLMQGLSYEQIAAALGRKTSTIRSQLNSAYHRLGVRTSYQAVLECVRAGWLVWSESDPETAVLMRVEQVLRYLVQAVETHTERQHLTGAQRQYLEQLDDYLYARDEPSRRVSRAGMDEALGAMLRDARVAVAGPRNPNDLVADLGAVIDQTRSMAA